LSNYETASAKLGYYSNPGIRKPNETGEVVPLRIAKAFGSIILPGQSKFRVPLIGRMCKIQDHQPQQAPHYNQHKEGLRNTAILLRGSVQLPLISPMMHRNPSTRAQHIAAESGGILLGKSN